MQQATTIVCNTMSSKLHVRELGAGKEEACKKGGGRGGGALCVGLLLNDLL